MKLITASIFSVSLLLLMSLDAGNGQFKSKTKENVSIKSNTFLNVSMKSNTFLSDYKWYLLLIRLKNSRIRELSINYKGMGHVRLKQILDLVGQNLRKLDIDECNFFGNENDIDLSNCSQLRTLRIGDATGQNITRLLRQVGRSLRKLYIHNFPCLPRFCCDCNNFDFENCRSLRKLVICGNIGSPEEIKNLNKCTLLKQLDLSFCNGMQSMKIVDCECPNLRKFKFFGVNNFEIIEAMLNSFIRLEELKLPFSCIQDEQLVQLIQKISQTLVTLDLCGSNCLKDINLSNYSNIRNINLKGTSLENVDLRNCSQLQFVDFEGCSSLRYVNFGKCTQLEKAIFLNCPNLEKMIMSENYEGASS